MEFASTRLIAADITAVVRFYETLTGRLARSRGKNALRSAIGRHESLGLVATGQPASSRPLNQPR